MLVVLYFRSIKQCKTDLVKAARRNDAYQTYHSLWGNENSHSKSTCMEVWGCRQAWSSGISISTVWQDTAGEMAVPSVIGFASVVNPPRGLSEQCSWLYKLPVGKGWDWLSSTRVLKALNPSDLIFPQGSHVLPSTFWEFLDGSLKSPFVVMLVSHMWGSFWPVYALWTRLKRSVFGLCLPDWHLNAQKFAVMHDSNWQKTHFQIRSLANIFL